MPAELQERVPVPHHHAGIVAPNIEKVAMHLQQQRNREASMVKVCWTGGDAALPETGNTGRDGAGVAPPAVVQLLHRWRERERERDVDWRKMGGNFFSSSLLPRLTS